MFNYWQEYKNVAADKIQKLNQEYLSHLECIRSGALSQYEAALNERLQLMERRIRRLAIFTGCIEKYPHLFAEKN